MARRVIVKTETHLDDADRDLIVQHVGPLIQAECAQAVKAISQGVWDDLNIGLADAGDWGIILSGIMCKEILTLEEIRERVGRLDTAARTPWWDVLEQIESRCTM